MFLSVLDLTNPEADYNAFHNACLPAHYGHGTELVYDESYRLAREICPEAFGLNFDPIKASNGVLSSISRLIDIPITAELYKINSYGPGGMFKAHQDTPRGQNHLGTLVVALPSHFEGGEFILRKSGEETTFDWSTSGRKDHPRDLHWIFFYADIEHEILPVKAGYRLTVSYHIFGSRDTDGSHDTESEHSTPGSEGGEFVLQTEGLPTGNLNLQYKLTPLFSTLISSYKDPKFLPNGGRLAFGLDHEYGVAGKSNVMFPDDYYKGKDAVCVSTLKAMGLSYQFKAVYRVSGDDYDCPEPDDFATASNGHLLLLWDEFAGCAYFVRRSVMELMQDAGDGCMIHSPLQVSLLKKEPRRTTAWCGSTGPRSTGRRARTRALATMRVWKLSTLLLR